MRRPPRLERLVSVPEIAAITGTSRWTVQRRLQTMFRQRGGDWLVTSGPRAKIFVNLPRLLRAYPGLFEPGFATREELEHIESRVAALEKRNKEEKLQRSRYLSRIRRLEEAGKRVQSGAAGGDPRSY